ncbi:glycosyltransferase [Candidatus Sumerlaeota bacterium]|nr:glycosyltransferase [Candidatus Sumerlaeota bacterium]
MSAEPRVTWLLPVRNGLPHLEEALASIEAQTLRDWAILAWDNGSTDDSVDVLHRWIPARLPGRVVTDRPAERLGGCLRLMVEAAGTELLARIDADDICDPSRLERQVAHLDLHPEIMALGSWMREIDAAGREGRIVSHPDTDPVAIRWMIPFFNPLYHPTTLMRRQAVLDAGNYSDMSTGQDWDLWCRLVQRGALAILPEPLIRYRVHPESVSSIHSAEWPELNRQLVERHAPDLFPGVPTETVLRVWRYISPSSDAQRRTPPSRRDVIAMAEAMARQAGWDTDETLRHPRIQSHLRRCRPTRLHQWPLYLALRLAMRLRGGRS